jgi:hypothetical protein
VQKKTISSFVSIETSNFSNSMILIDSVQQRGHFFKLIYFQAKKQNKINDDNDADNDNEDDDDDDDEISMLLENQNLLDQIDGKLNRTEADDDDRPSDDDDLLLIEAARKFEKTHSDAEVLPKTMKLPLVQKPPDESAKPKQEKDAEPPEIEFKPKTYSLFANKARGVPVVLESPKQQQKTLRIAECDFDSPSAKKRKYEPETKTIFNAIAVTKTSSSSGTFANTTVDIESDKKLEAFKERTRKNNQNIPRTKLISDSAKASTTNEANKFRFNRSPSSSPVLQPKPVPLDLSPKKPEPVLSVPKKKFNFLDVEKRVVEKSRASRPVEVKIRMEDTKLTKMFKKNPSRETVQYTTKAKSKIFTCQTSTDSSIIQRSKVLMQARNVLISKPAVDHNSASCQEAAKTTATERAKQGSAIVKS